MYERYFALRSPHPMHDFGHDYTPRFGHDYVARFGEEEPSLLGLRRKPVVRLAVLGGVGGLLGRLAFGGPLGLVGGVVLGVVADEVLARVQKAST